MASSGQSDQDGCGAPAAVNCAATQLVFAGPKTCEAFAGGLFAAVAIKTKEPQQPQQPHSHQLTTVTTTPTHISCQQCMTKSHTNPTPTLSTTDERRSNSNLHHMSPMHGQSTRDTCPPPEVYTVSVAQQLIVAKISRSYQPKLPRPLRDIRGRHASSSSV